MSSLVRDYNHYYQHSWVGIQENGLLIPIFVETVIDTSELSSDDWSEEHREQLMIHGIRYDKRERDGRIVASSITTSVMNPALVLESPDVGYVHSGRDIRWAVIRPVRQRLKGMVSNKVNGTNIGRGTETSSIIYNLFNPDFEGMINRYLFVAPSNNRIYYKGAEIGQVFDDRIHLINRFFYLIPQIQGCERYANLPISEVEAL